MIIRHEQFKVFLPQAEADFEARVVEYLKEEHWDELVRLPSGEFLIEELPDETLLTMVRQTASRARQFGMKLESSLMAFIVLAVVSAPNFDEHPLIRRILNDNSTQPDERIERLWDKTTEENWEAVEKNYDVDAWGLSAQRG
jgi:hypothetical protein